MEDNFDLDPTQRLRLSALTHLDAGRLTSEQVATRLGMTQRQVWRLVEAFHREGPASVVHGNRGRSPANRTDLKTVERVIAFARGKYRDFNDQQLTEHLNEIEGVAISRRTVARILRNAGMPSPKTHRVPKHRRRRERSAQEGELLQADGCKHDWLEGRGPIMTLVAIADDATSKPWAQFREEEDTEGYVRVMRKVTSSQGIPLAFYSDQDSVFKVSETHHRVRRDPWFDEEPITQFGRMLGELGIRLILANSPQGKGRIERFFETAQDRLVSLLRLYNATNMADANRVLSKYLPDYMRRFGVPARVPETAWLPWPEHLDPDDVFCLKFNRVLARNHTVSLDAVTYDVPPDPTHQRRHGRKLTVQRHFDGTVKVVDGQSVLAIYPPARPVPRPPAADHPWRRGQ